MALFSALHGQKKTVFPWRTEAESTASGKKFLRVDTDKTSAGSRVFVGNGLRQNKRGM